MSVSVFAHVLGGEKKVVTGVATIADVKKAMNAEGYTAAINGSPANDSDVLTDGVMVTLSKAVKGGC